MAEYIKSESDVRKHVVRVSKANIHCLVNQHSSTVAGTYER